MHSNEKETALQNLQDLKEARLMLVNRAADEHACFESLLSLNKASLTMCLAPDLGDDEVAALCELLMLQGCLLQAAYAHYRLRGTPAEDLA